MGLRHLRAASNLTNVNVTAAYDIHPERAADAGKPNGTYTATSLDDVIGCSEAVVIAAPTRAHSSIAEHLLSAGIHCLVEKPLAQSEAECQSLIDLAAIKNLVLQAGHVERFNPAVRSLFTQQLTPEDILSITSRRMNPPTGRTIEDDVVMDLMVHDLDLIGALKNSPVETISATALGPEQCQAELTFADGAVAQVIASRTAETQIRDLEIKTKNGTYLVDYAKRRAYHIERTESSAENALDVSDDDPLEQQLLNFAESIRQSTQPQVTGVKAFATMKLAWRIQAALKGQP